MPSGYDSNQPKADENWLTYKNERFGYQLYYPAAVFVPSAPDDDADEDDDDEGVVVYRPGMRMEDLERAASGVAEEIELKVLSSHLKVVRAAEAGMLHEAGGG